MSFREEVMQGYIDNTVPLEEMLCVRGKAAIVTGGTSGLGFCVAQRLLQGGAKVVISSSTEEKGNAALALLRGAGYQDVYFQKADVRSDEEVEKLVEFTADTCGSVDILVTCAGVWSFAHIYDLPEEEFMNTLNINLAGTYRCVKYASRYMIEHGVQGKMVLVSSNSAYFPYPVFGGYAHYAASKGGVVSMAYELAKELLRYGIIVNTVAPGGMVTPGTRENGAVGSLTPEQQAEIYQELMVMRSDVTPEADTVAMVVYGLCTRMADGVTGTCIVADYGQMLLIQKHQPEIKEYPPT